MKIIARCILITVLFLSLFSAPLLAANVVLKSGALLKGEIVERTDDYIKINVYGVVLPYFLTEVSTIDGKAVEAKIVEPPGSAEVPSGESQPNLDSGPVAPDARRQSEPLLSPGLNDNGIFINRDFGFSLRLPEGWTAKVSGTAGAIFDKQIQVNFSSPDGAVLPRLVVRAYRGVTKEEVLFKAMNVRQRVNKAGGDIQLIKEPEDVVLNGTIVKKWTIELRKMPSFVPPPTAAKAGAAVNQPELSNESSIGETYLFSGEEVVVSLGLFLHNDDRAEGERDVLWPSVQSFKFLDNP